MGFPSYWNIVLVYMMVAGLSQAANGIILLTFAALVFVPIRYVYPSRTKDLQAVTLVLGAIWGVLMCVMLWQFPRVSATVFRLALVFPVYYLALSLYLQFRRT
jgi:phosphatidylcholine synthase